MNSGIRILGELHGFITNIDTLETRHEVYHNLVVNNLLNNIATLLVGKPANTPMQFQFGTGTTTPDAGDNALAVPVANTRTTLSTRTVAGAQCTFGVNYPAGVISGNFTEAGLLDANGVLLTHLLLNPVISIASNEASTFLYYLTVTV